MELWNDFEGKTVAGRFPLERLLGPQGRSAFFATTANGSGPAVIRLIETHFDEEEILGRWRTVMGLQEPHLQALTVCGETTLDGTKLVYAVLEPTDMELADALRERPLTVAETRQVTAAVLSALERLHAAGLVHEHVEPAYVLAQEEMVKLRSDCVREAPEEGAEAARAADVRGLALLVAECLTQARDESRAGTLPAPFAEMVRRGAAGEWGLPEMRSALEGPVLVRPGMAPAAVAVAAPAGAGPGMRPAAAARVTVTAPARGDGGAASEPQAGAQASPVSGPERASVSPAVAAAAEEHTPASVAARVAAVHEPRSGAALGRLDTEAGRVHGIADADRIVMDPVEDESRRGGLWAGLGVAAVVLFGWGGWHAMHRAPAAPVAAPVAASAPATAGPAAARTSGEAAAPTATASAPRKSSAATPAPAKSPAARGEAAPAASAAGHGSWRVVAFTYNREDQARHKAEQIDARHAGLHAEAWSPSGRAPWLVALGGWLDQREAEALVSRARRDGLPRDTFARNYRR